MVSDIWPQWRCTSDPEDQATGAIDPAWFAIVRVLLEEARKQDVKVVLTLTYLNEGHFATFNGSAALDQPTMAHWQDHRRQPTGKDGYRDAEAHRCWQAPGYYGQVGEQALFTDLSIREHLVKRFVAMADFAARFPALGALEFFNEPQIELTEKADFWAIVKQSREAIRRSSPQGARIPMISGVSAWDPAIVQQAKAAGEFDKEAFIAVHVYEDFSKGGAPALARLKDLVAWLRRIAPGKAIAVAEVGSKEPISSAAVHQQMVDAVFAIHREAKVGVWVWGDWFPQPDEQDFKWDFNHRSPVGGAFRRYVAAPIEDAYRTPQRRMATDEGSHAAMPLTVGLAQIGPNEADPYLRSRWRLLLDDKRMVGFSRAGAFLRANQMIEDAGSSPPLPSYFIGDPGPNLQWSDVVPSATGWTLRVYDCAVPSTNDAAVSTPDALIGLASDEKRDDFLACKRSRLHYKVDL